MVVIAGPQNDYLPPEIDAIHKYLQDGGRALVMLDAGVELPNLTKMLGDWGVTARNDLVIDENPVAQIFGTEPYMPLIVKYGTSPIVQPLNGRATLFPLSRSFEVGKDSKPGVTADSLCDTSADSYGVTDWNPKIKEIKFRRGQGPERSPLRGRGGHDLRRRREEDGRPLRGPGNFPDRGQQLPEFSKQPRLHHELHQLAFGR